MHRTSFETMTRFVETRLRDRIGLRVLDVGSYNVNGSYRDLFANHVYVGADIRPGPNVDLVLPDPYRWELDEKYDVVISGQTLEHVEDIGLLVREIAATLKSGGLTCLIAPWTWRYHEHPVDCWRIFPQGMRWLMRQAGLTELEIYRNGNDTVGIAEKGAEKHG